MFGIRTAGRALRTPEAHRIERLRYVPLKSGNQPIRIPLRARDGTILAYALVDSQDALLAGHRWSMDPDGYAYRRDDGRRRSLHRSVLGLETGDPREGDHVNGDRLDCRRGNLRIVTHAQNAQNRRPRAGARSRYRGVTWSKDRRRWRVDVMVGGRRWIEHHDDEDEAGAAAARIRRERMTHTNEARA